MKRPTRGGDLNQRAAAVVAAATDDTAESVAVITGRRGGLKGGRVRAERLTPEERSEIARHAAQVRWSAAREA